MTTTYTQVSKTRELSQHVIHTLKIKIISALRWPSAADTVKKDSINVPRCCCFKFLLNQNQLDLTTALSSILSSRTHFSLLSFPPLPFLPCWSSCKCNSGGVIVETHSDTMGHRLIEERLLSHCFHFLSLKWNGIQQNTKEILHLLDKAQRLFTYK